MIRRTLNGIGIGAGWPNWCWQVQTEKTIYGLQICRWPGGPWFDWRHYQIKVCCKVKSWELTVFKVMFGVEIQQVP